MITWPEPTTDGLGVKLYRMKLAQGTAVVVDRPLDHVLGSQRFWLTLDDGSTFGDEAVVGTKEEADAVLEKWDRA